MSKLKVIIDGRMFQESGIGRYIRNLIAELQIIDKKNEYFILHLKNDYDRLVYHNNFHKVLANFRWYGIEEQIRLPKLLDSLSPDLVHFPHFNVPIFYNRKFVVTIHDLIHQHFSMERSTTHGPVIYQLKKLGYKKVFEHATEKSSATVVPSNFVKQQLIQDWGVDGSKVTVTYEAVDDKIMKKSQMSNVKCQILFKKLNVRQPYIFYVGNAHPHKNVEGLIEVFLLLKKKYADLKLVLTGYDHYFWQRIKRQYRHKDIIYTGYVTDEELVGLYKSARMFVMPSFEEGFGMPILEAMACECPVVSSNAGSLPEVGGDAAVYFDPGNQGDMEGKVDMVLQSEEKRKELIEKGFKRYREFSWQKLARETLEIYQQCV